MSCSWVWAFQWRLMCPLLLRVCRHTVTNGTKSHEMVDGSHHCHRPIAHDNPLIIPHFGLLLFRWVAEILVIPMDSDLDLCWADSNSQVLNFHLALLKWRALMESKAGCLLLLFAYLLLLPKFDYLMEPEKALITVIWELYCLAGRLDAPLNYPSWILKATPHPTDISIIKFILVFSRVGMQQVTWWCCQWSGH